MRDDFSSTEVIIDDYSVGGSFSGEKSSALSEEESLSSEEEEDSDNSYFAGEGSDGYSPSFDVNEDIHALALNCRYGCARITPDDESRRSLPL